MQKDNQKGFIQTILLAITLLIIFFIIFTSLVTAARIHREGNFSSVIAAFLEALRK